MKTLSKLDAQTWFAILLLAFVMLTPPSVWATETTIKYRLPTGTCDGAVIGNGDILQAEIYVSAAPIPALDQPCPGAGATVDEPPANFSTRVELETTTTGADADHTATVDLFGGHYFARARVRTADGWSNLSNQIEFSIPVGPVRAPVIIDITF